MQENAISKSSKKSKVKIFVNVDTVDFYLKGRFSNLGASVVTAKKVGGKIIDEYGNRVRMKGKHGAHSIHVRTLNSGSRLLFQGSPYAYCYGQNLYTSSDLQRGCRIVIRHAIRKFGIEHTADQLQRWNDGDVYLKRVDLAVNFQAASEMEGCEVLHQVGRQLYESGRSMSRFDSTVYLKPRDGKEYQMVFYAKGPQMRSLQRYKNLPGKQQLLDHCEGIFRIELRLLASELKKLGLDKASAWESDTAETVFRKYMATKLKLLTVTSGPLANEDLSGLDDRMRPVLALHKTGGYSASVYSERTRQRHFRYFRQRGIDLNCPNQPVKSITSLTKYLSPKKVINDAPQWMKDMGLVPISGKDGKERKNAQAEKPREQVVMQPLCDDEQKAIEINKPDRWGRRIGKIF